MRPHTFVAPRNIPPLLLAGYVAAIAAVIAIAVLAKASVERQAAAGALVTQTLTVRERLASILSAVKDAETGQRGYLLTGLPEYLEPFDKAVLNIPVQLQSLGTLIGDSPSQREHLAEIGPVIGAKFAELRETIELRRSGEAARSLEIVRSGRGKETMDRIRQQITLMDLEQHQVLTERSADWKANTLRTVTVMIGGSALLLVLIVAAGAGTLRELAARERQAWLRTGQAEVSKAVVGEQSIEALAQNVLDQSVRYTGAAVGALYVVHDDGTIRLAARYALSSDAQQTLARGEGMAGQALASREVVHLDRLPASYLQVASSVGATVPIDVLVAPAHTEGVSFAVMELAFLRRAEPRIRELLEQISESIAVAMRTALIRARMVELLRKTQKQAQELQAQEEELRVNNEELEEQSRSLQESQARMETQQAELEQINERLQEQATLLERQKDELSESHEAVAAKNDELELANRHKTEFVANMSHELRTPLNSSLILAKLLADNKPGNMSEEQVRFASTIYSAGNDLLNLINDVLDLAKVEAGKVEVRPEPVVIAGLVEGLLQTFRPVANQKGVRFVIAIEEGTAATLDTDRQRLEQVLKNLLANAFKFTERGEVSLTVSSSGDSRVSFAIKDTGLGIASDQHDLIFQAFKQVDSGANRRFGGTGLGLSISRDLAQALGGDIHLISAPGQGSTFTVVLPRRFSSQSTAPQVTIASRLAAKARAEPPATALDATLPMQPADDGARRLLIVEDDPAFAEVLSALGREQGFQCLVATRADEAVQLAATRAPSAILLDVRLPDHSGLSVLDRVKRNPATRHIPVHVISAIDYSQTAMEMGAVGYALKPVARDELLDALRKLMSAADAHVRRVLVVEDNDVQRDSICHLLSGDGVETIGVATTADGLTRLRETTFHCMVLDLNLPDATGYDMLEVMAADDNYSFPPVIVYTAGSLSASDEERLRRFSRSIIIKGARSPERLLDEVTLFLHQVEARLPADRRKMLQQARDRETLFEGRIILLAEDDVRNIFALSSVIEPKGAKLEIARNGREALERLARPPHVDLVLMDIMMPEMDGLEAMRQIRARRELDKVPIIALTAKAMRDDQEKCLAAGANDYVAKPIDVDKLLSLIRVWMPKQA